VSEFKDFFKSYNLLSKKYNFNYLDNGWLGLYGITCNDTLVAKKIYFNIEKPIDNDDFIFLEKKHLYNKYIKFIDYNRCLCNCVARKHDIINNVFSSYFHIKLDNIFNFKECDRFFNLNLSQFSKAVSVEFNEYKTDIKRYYYIYDSESIAYILQLFRINEDYNKIKYIEYTHNPKKIILIYKDMQDTYAGLRKNSKENILEHVNQYNSIFNSKPILFGRYFNSEKTTVYWDIKKENLNNFIKIIN